VQAIAAVRSYARLLESLFSFLPRNSTVTRRNFLLFFSQWPSFCFSTNFLFGAKREMGIVHKHHDFSSFRQKNTLFFPSMK